MFVLVAANAYLLAEGEIFKVVQTSPYRDAINFNREG